jgi:hypothetical protein
MAQLPPLPEGPSLQQIRVPQAPMVANDFTWELFAGIGLLLLTLFLGRKWLIAGLYTLRRSRQASLSPQEQAHAELDANRLHTDAVHFAAGIHNCLLRYFKNEYAIGSESDSSAEIIAAIQQHLCLKTQVELDLIHILKQCEQIKFSQQSLDPAARERLDQRAQALLNNLNPTSPGTVT